MRSRLGGPSRRAIGLVALCGAGVAAAAVAGPGLPAAARVDGTLGMTWWMLAVVFAACELAGYQVDLRRSRDASIVIDLALVIGLLLATPADLLLAQVVGATVVLAWRGRPLELGVRLARLVLGAVVALVVFGGLAPGRDSTGPEVWACAGLAVLGAAIARRALFSAGVRVAADGMDRPAVLAALGRDVLVTATSTSVGLAVVTLLAFDARSVWLLLLPAGLLGSTGYAYLREREGHARVDCLHAATRALLQASKREDALAGVMAGSRAAFRAGYAELVLLAPQDAAPRRTRGEADALEPVPPEFAGALQALAAGDGGARMLEQPPTDPMLARYLRRAGVRGPAMTVALRSDDRAFGLILVADRPGSERPFGPADLRLLDQLAEHVASPLAHENLEEDFGRLEQLQSRLEHLAYHDSLTGLVNRVRFGEQAAHALARRDTLVAALFIDLDDFKTVNDSLGHPAGDALLVAVADRLRSSLRPTDLPARLGGDEFAVLIEDAESMEVVIEIAQRVLEALEAPLGVAHAELVVRASIGVSTSREGGRRAEDLLRNADLAMYRAKHRGKRRFELFAPEMHALAVQRHELKSELQRAVDENQFVVLYQPVVDLRSGRIAGVEALVRWEHPRLGLLGPDDFVGIAEESGLIAAIGRLVLGAACDRLGVWRAAGIAGEAFTLSLNLSARELQAPDLVEVLTRAAGRAGVPASAIILDVTESVLMHDLDTGGVTQVALIKAAGFRLAIDDFGTGHSSLGHLRRFPIDVLKVAKPFVDHVTERAEDAALMRSILELSRTLSLEVVVEGVETAEQAQLLLGLGARLVQGFVYSTPVDHRVLSALLTLTPLEGFGGGLEPDGLREGSFTAGISTVRR